jgi:alkyldihydroxyacetonephosphate synthase
MNRNLLRWNGWGLIDAPDVLGERADAAWAWMGRTLGVGPLPETPAVALGDVRLPACRLAPADLAALADLADPARVHTDPAERAGHARGKSYHDLLHLRAGHVDPAPDAVVYPETAGEVLAIAAFAAREGIALVPFGGGSSVVGGVTPLAGSHRAVIAVDLTRMDRLLDLDEVALVARFEAGIHGPALEAALQARGYTLGHYPQSFEFSTLGGWIAARGAGQQSIRYGKAERWLVSARLATPGGFWDTEGFPASAAGPQLNALVPGSEGRLGIITDATVRVRPLPAARDYRAYLFQEFAHGVEAARALVQGGLPLAMVRLSDPEETFFFNALQHPAEADSITARFCVMIIGIEGDAAGVEQTRAASRAVVEAHGGMHMGSELGAQWYANRFSMPYLRDPMLDRGLGLDTLETATRWSNILPMHAAVGAAIQEAMDAHPGVAGARGVVFCHISHGYPDGASLYFTFSFLRDPSDPVGQWQAIKAAASDTILAHGGTISHHHGVGTDHLPWAAREKGPLGTDLLRGIGRKVDPHQNLNPGKLFD